MKELVVISGKGGTGKTSIVASFASLARNMVLADCDVDAADLHLVMAPKILRREEFRAGYEAIINKDLCTECGKCRELCRYNAISEEFGVDRISCEGCGVCAEFCPAGAIEMRECTAGDWFVSETRFGPMVHARLGIAEENSGKLVTMVRNHARELAEQKNSPLILVDGPPGIGCPVISSLTGASLVLVVTEPTLSGLHDMERVLSLARFFKIPSVVCVNKYDLNPQITEKIEAQCRQQKVRLVGKIPYDNAVTRAQLMGKSVVEYSGSPVSMAIRRMWEEVAVVIAEEVLQRVVVRPA
ncbi:MAG: 4Fe-4S binding protein [Deltaproteobacteria bacterium]|nr:4Fe-4S binding protein [Deltaproteobacteria bacterium]